jgi:phosphoribosylformylglycinamidine cyclo-ligase
LPPIFAVLQEGGDVAASEMARTFNCGIGMAAMVAPDAADAVVAELEQAGETVHRIGRVERGDRGCTVRGTAGNWGSDDEWTAAHHA